jgi:chorismate lyase / 3-hydroxybenzoate synthase
MDILLSPAPAGYADAVPSAPALPPLRVEYSTDPATDVLTRSEVLAVVSFGQTPSRDPRLIQVALEPACGSAPLEVWCGHGHAGHGANGDLRWSSDGNYSFVTLTLHERDFGGITAAAQHAYAQLSAWCKSSATPHLLRLWNYLDAINLGDGDDERYRQFCSGRAAGMDALTAGYPAASAIGVRDGRRVLQVCALAGRHPGAAVENPRQTSAWRYPRQYGPVAPGFARAMRAPSHSPQLYISGTAAVVGHASYHAGDVCAQVDETLTNLQSLCAAAGSAHPLGGARSVLKAYVRHAADADLVRERLHARFGADTPLLVLLGDICRAELLVEIDGLHDA